jgi:hypothetical protein
MEKNGGPSKICSTDMNMKKLWRLTADENYDYELENVSVKNGEEGLRVMVNQ